MPVPPRPFKKDCIPFGQHEKPRHTIEEDHNKGTDTEDGTCLRAGTSGFGQAGTAPAWVGTSRTGTVTLMVSNHPAIQPPSAIMIWPVM
jgi:hypothetical protein